MAEKKEFPIDIDGTEIVSTALRQLLNQFPGLDGKAISFSSLSETHGLAFFPTSGAVLVKDTEDITGHVKQECMYPFTVVYRASPKNEDARIRLKEFLDTLGKWLEKQPVTVSKQEYKLDKYPDLEQGRVIKSIKRSNPAHLARTYPDGVEDWEIAVSLKYESEFDR